jgi:Ferroportin1 (FPN1)
MIRHSEETPLIVPSASASVSVTTGEEVDEVLEVLRKARRVLYVSHFSAQFSECAWQFALILFLAGFTNYTSLLLVSSYGLTSELTVCFAGPSAGRYFVDSLDWNRLKAAQFLIWTQNLCVVIASVFCYALLTFLKQHQEQDVTDSQENNWFQRKFQGVPLDLYSVLLLIGVHIFGSLARILDKVFLVTIERDWVVVMGQVAADLTNKEDTDTSHHTQPSKSWLADTNVFMKQIDLTCRVTAPAVAGVLIGAATSPVADTSHKASNDLANAALLIGFINAASLMVEYLCTAQIYRLVPALAQKINALPTPRQSENDKKRDEENDKNVTELEPVRSLSRKEEATGFVSAKLPPGLKIYMDQPVSWAGLGLAML